MLQHSNMTHALEDFEEAPWHRPGRRFIIPLGHLWSTLEDRCRVLTRAQIDMRQLIGLAVSHTVARKNIHSWGYLFNTARRIAVSSNPEQCLSEPGKTELIHGCIDFVGEASAILSPIIAAALGHYSESVEFDRFVGRDAVLRCDAEESMW